MRRLAVGFVVLGVLAAGAALADTLPITGPITFGSGMTTKGANVKAGIADNATLLTTPTTAVTDGIWRLDYSAGFGAPPLFYRPSNSACSLNSGNGDNGSQVKSADSKCWLAVFPAAGADAREWGADFTNGADASVQLQKAFTWAANNSSTVELPCGTAKFNTALSIPSGLNRFGIVGSGYCSALIYNGANTTNDIITIGTVGSAARTTEIKIDGFRLDSLTQMTGGAALHLWHVILSTVDPVIGGQFGNGKFFNGIWFDECDVVVVPLVMMTGASNDVVLVNGSKPAEAWFPNYVGEIRFGQGKISGADGQPGYPAVGVHVAGSVGGLSFDAVDIIANKVNLLVDNAVTGVENQTITISVNTFLDSSVNDNVVLNDTAALSAPFGNTKRIFIYGWVACGGCAGTAGNGINVQNYLNGQVILGGYNIGGNKGFGVYDQDATATIEISSSVLFSGNSGTSSIASSVASPKISINNPTFTNEAGGPFDANTLTSVLPIYGGPFAWTPVLAFGGSSTGIAYSNRQASYLLQGMDAVADFTFTLSAVAGSGAAGVSGLPFGQAACCQKGGGGGLFYAINFTGLTGNMVLSMDSGGGPFFAIYQAAPTGFTVVGEGNFTATSQVAGRVSFVRP